MRTALKVWLPMLAIAAICLGLYASRPSAWAASPSPLVQQYGQLATGARPPGEFAMLLRLNGSPTKLGTIVSADGTTKNNTTTSTPFTISYGDTILVECDAAARCIEGLTASTTVTNSAYGVSQAINTGRYWVLNDTGVDGGTGNTVFACVGAGAFNCAVWKMR